MGARGRARPKHEVAEVIRQFEAEYSQQYRYSSPRGSAMRHILQCRTAALGGQVRGCQACGKVEIAYNSCKDRHCPKCGAYDKAQWLEAQKVWVLPIAYYQVVFTIDHVFNPLVWANKKKLNDLLLRTAAALLKAYGQRYLGGELGFTLVLHTWGQQMQRHPHVHAMVTGGALVEADGVYRWQAAGPTYLFPAEEFSAAFRAAFCEGIRQLWQQGKLNLGRNQAIDVEQLLLAGENQKWEVYIQTPRGKPGDLLDYLGRYVYKTALSNHRIIAVGPEQVRFKYYDNRDDGKLKEMELAGVEFLRRFLDHVLPKRFQRIRHYGLHHSSQRKKLALVRRLLGLAVELPTVQKLNLVEWLREILGKAEPFRCPYCGQGLLEVLREFEATAAWRLKFAPLLGLAFKWGWGI